MTTQEKAEFRFHIVEMDRQCVFNFEKNYYELDYYEINKLDKYAEIFGIKSTNSGQSRSRKLWYNLQNIYYQNN